MDNKNKIFRFRMTEKERKELKNLSKKHKNESEFIRSLIKSYKESKK